MIHTQRFFLFVLIFSHIACIIRKSSCEENEYNGLPYDFIFGPVANDDVYTTFTLYTAGVLTKEQTVDALKVKKLYDQLVLTSEKSIVLFAFYSVRSARRNSNGSEKI